MALLFLLLSWLREGRRNELPTWTDKPAWIDPGIPPLKDWYPTGFS